MTGVFPAGWCYFGSKFLRNSNPRIVARQAAKIKQREKEECARGAKGVTLAAQNFVLYEETEGQKSRKSRHGQSPSLQGYNKEIVVLKLGPTLEVGLHVNLLGSV